MKREITLYDIKREDGNWFSLTAYLNNGELRLASHDFCKLAEDMYGNEEHETFYQFNVENTTKLAAVLKTKNLLKWLQLYFDGKMRDREFLSLCEKNNIKYSSFSWF